MPAKSVDVCRIIFMEPYAKLTGVCAVDNEASLELGTETVVGQGNNVAKLLSGIVDASTRFYFLGRSTVARSRTAPAI